MALVVFEGTEVFFFPLEFLKLRDNFLSEYAFNLSKLVVLFENQLQSLLFLRLIETDAGCLLDESEYLLGLHVDDLGHTPLHNKEVRVVDVEFDGAEEHLDFFSRLHLPIDVVLRLAGLDRAAHTDRRQVYIAWG